MDNITHSLIGAVLGQAGLKRLSGMGMPTLIIAANIPDIDAACFFWLEGQEHLGFRRGITHGPIALLLLPLALTAIMIAYDRWQARKGTRPRERLPVRFVPLYLLALIGTISHPFFDWLNNYGIRLLEPFSSRWFYGDSLFIIDVWMWTGLGLSYWISRRRERARRTDWRRPALFGLAALATYVLMNMAISTIAERMIRTQLLSAGVTPTLVVASPPPLLFWQRDVFWRNDERYGRGKVNLLGDSDVDSIGNSTGMNDALIQAAVGKDSSAAAFLFWARMPFAYRDGGNLVIGDQRFSDELAAGRFSIAIPLTASGPAQRQAGQ
ncbi:metal-dependent hydrolase [Sphingomonas lacunae]|uniref:Metal-dependent hydrolase n=1 Tax=Sphingomonas lacunae TaxID=2698828 RepID=A0A6M4B044_9SPHN|nr:metal-dependent hydrolase [Sphingomonas lacunae]